MDKTNKTKVKSQDVKFGGGLYKVEECGNTTFLTTSHFGKNPLRVLPNREYVDTRTGEVFQMKEASKTRGDNMRVLKKSLARLSKIIDYNIARYKSYLCFTLTYAENMTDTKKLYRDWVNFWKRFVREFGEDAVSDYVLACEPQGRGAWHIHCVLFQKKKSYIPGKRLAEIWGLGMVDVDKRKNDLDSVGSYLVGYLSDMKLDDFEHLIESSNTEEKSRLMQAMLNENHPITQKQEHQIIKGIRMLLYPARFRFFRWSRGIEQPTEKKEVVQKEELKKYGSCVSAKEFEVELDDGKTLIVQRFIFKKKLNKKFNPLEV